MPTSETGKCALPRFARAGSGVEPQLGPLAGRSAARLSKTALRVLRAPGLPDPPPTPLKLMQGREGLSEREQSLSVKAVLVKRCASGASA